MDCGGWDVACVVGLDLNGVWVGIVKKVQIWKAEYSWLFDWVVLHGHNIFAALGFALAAWKFWRTREAVRWRLLGEMLAREERRLASTRADLIRIIARPSPAVRSEQPLFVVSRLKRVLRKRGWVRTLSPANAFTSTDRHLKAAIAQLDKQQDAAERRLEFYRQQRSAALVLKGVIASTRADSAAEKSTKIAFSNTAQISFDEATKVQNQENDIDAWEFKGLQHLKHDQFEDADNAFAKVEALAEALKTPKLRSMVKGRASRHRAQAQHNGRFGDSNKSLLRSLAELQCFAPLSGRDLLELAATHEFRMYVADKSGFVRVAPESKRDSAECYRQLVISLQPHNLSLLRRIWRLMKRSFHDDGSRRLLDEAVAGLARVDAYVIQS
jgi:hypothetical protein